MNKEENAKYKQETLLSRFGTDTFKVGDQFVVVDSSYKQEEIGATITIIEVFQCDFYEYSILKGRYDTAELNGKEPVNIKWFAGKLRPNAERFKYAAEITNNQDYKLEFEILKLQFEETYAIRVGRLGCEEKYTLSKSGNDRSTGCSKKISRLFNSIKDAQNVIEELQKLNWKERRLLISDWGYYEPKWNVVEEIKESSNIE